MPITTPPAAPWFAGLTDRALIEVSGPDWRGFLQGLVTQDVETLAAGEARFGALLTPQGRVLFDLFLIGREDGCLIDCAAERREALIQRLGLYRLRAKVMIAPGEQTVSALWNATSAPESWLADPRLPALGWRGYGESAPEGALIADLAAYDAHRLAAGVPGPVDWGEDRAYPIEANFDLLHGVDFKKGCFIGQETTSRMKRRGAIKTRMALIAFDGAAPAAGSELLAGELRAGEVLSAGERVAMAFVRLDRLDAGALRLADGRAWRVERALWTETPAV
jgi:folate-binding protein YgfZ